MKTCFQERAAAEVSLPSRVLAMATRIYEGREDTAKVLEADVAEAAEDAAPDA